MKPPLFSCLMSRVTDNGSLYGRFLLGPLPIDLSLTVATVLRRSLLNNRATFTIVEVEIEGAYHEYASLPGVQESVLEILLNLGEIVLTSSQANCLGSNFRTSIKPFSSYFAFIKISGPCIITAKDISWPKEVFCVKPDAYIASLSSNETFLMRIKIAPNTLEKHNTYHSNKVKARKLVSLISNKNEISDKNLINSFEFFRLKRNEKQDISNTLSTLSNENLEIVSPLKQSNFYSVRKSENTNNKHFSQIEKNPNLSDVFLSCFPLSEVTLENLLENSQIKNKSKTSQEKNETNVTFQTFPSVNNIKSPELFINNNKKVILKNKDKIIRPLIKTNLLTKPLTLSKQDFTKNSLLYKEISPLTDINIKNLPLKESVPLSVSCSSYPVEKVNFLIERDDELLGYRHRIILEVWTNGSISPRQAIFNSIGSIMRLIYSFREPVRNLFKSNGL